MRSTGTVALLVVLVVVGFAGCSGLNTYNRLVTEDERVEQAWADVQSQYQRRADLVPNLVNTVRGAADFERGTLESVTEARARATSITLSVDDLSDEAAMMRFQQAQSELGGALSRLLAVTENYPELRATEAFRDLQVQLEGTENRIATARRDYNRTVQAYNTSVRRFPASIVAGLSGFDRRVPFQADEAAQTAPTVDFNS